MNFSEFDRKSAREPERVRKSARETMFANKNCAFALTMMLTKHVTFGHSPDLSKLKTAQLT